MRPGACQSQPSTLPPSAAPRGRRTGGLSAGTDPGSRPRPRPVPRPAPGREMREPSGWEGDEIDVEPALGRVAGLAWRQAVVHHPDDGTGLVELLAARSLIAHPVGMRGNPRMVEWLGAGTDHGSATRDTDPVRLVTPQAARIEEPQVVMVLDHRGCLDEMVFPRLRGPQEPVGRPDGRESVARQLLRVDRGRLVAAVAVALPQEPRRPVRPDEHARIDGSSLVGGADERRGRVVDERAGWVCRGGARDALRVGPP